jgi:hypothetical protein
MIEQVIFFGMRNRVSVILAVIFFFGSIIYMIPLL